jgi:hypothetical protein
MNRRRLAVLGLALWVVGCSAPTASRSTLSDEPRTRCLNRPGRGESYAADRPLFFLFCIESP